MDSEPGRSLIVWTVRLAVACYCGCLWIRVARSELKSHRPYRWLWAVSWAFCLIHVLCAYHFEHHWSQAAALKHTADLTEKVVGLYWSGGLYINYLFLILWGADVIRCFQTQRFTGAGMQIAAAFMMFNATVVFGPRWWLIAFALLALVLSWTARRRNTIAVQ